MLEILKQFKDFDLYKLHQWRTIYVLWNKIVILFDVITHKNFLDSLSNLTCSRNNTFVWMAGSAVSPIQEENDEKKKKMSFQELLWNFEFLKFFRHMRTLSPSKNYRPTLKISTMVWRIEFFFDSKFWFSLNIFYLCFVWS